jgi:alkanesulfonate monooxygenase SsuD/methylene tetrahydromethanopterin reductase-like flavin-dependent oxidoreductase (luciferase family)
MEFGLQFFPDVGPAQRSGEEYWTDALYLSQLGEQLGFTSIRTVEHYFHPYGGYSPNPLLFLTAAAMVTSKARLITGALLPAFNHPLKLAGEIGMLDAISHGRLEVGFARAFLPHEFARFSVTPDESNARFDEGVELVRRLLEEERVSAKGQFHQFEDVTSLPRPTQKPRPPFWLAALATPASFERAGRLGYDVMAIPLAGGQMADLIGGYRKARKQAGHNGPGRVMLAFHLLCTESEEQAIAIGRAPLNAYLKSLVDGASGWLEGKASSDYPNYDKIIAALAKETFETQREKGAAWIGTPDVIIQQIKDYHASVGGFEIASLQVNFNVMERADAEASMRLFAAQVLPYFTSR